MSLPSWTPKSKRSAVGRRWAKAKAIKRIADGVDAETLRMRALHDAKGRVERWGCDYSGISETRWQIRRSVDGSVRQYDLVVNGQCVRTGAKRTAERAVRWRIWRSPAKYPKKGSAI